MAELHELSQDRRLRNHFNIDKRRRTSRHIQPDPHFHSYYEFYYLIDGACRFFVLDTMYTLASGDLLICAPGEYHRNSYYGSQMHDRFTVYFDSYRITEELVPYLGFLPDAPGGRRQYHIPEHLQEDFLDLQNYMLHQYQLDSPEGEFSLVHLLPVYLMFIHQNAQPAAMENQQTNQTEQALQAAAQYIASHFSDAITLDQVSASLPLTSPGDSRTSPASASAVISPISGCVRPLPCCAARSCPSLKSPRAAASRARTISGTSSAWLTESLRVNTGGRKRSSKKSGPCSGRPAVSGACPPSVWDKSPGLRLEESL